MVFDGANIWVTNGSNDHIIKLQASGGTSLCTFPVGSFPFGIAFDGADILVTNSGSNTVSKM